MNGLTVLVVGASSGIGLGLVQAWLEAGSTVIASVRDDQGEAALKALSRTARQRRSGPRLCGAHSV